MRTNLRETKQQRMEAIIRDQEEKKNEKRENDECKEANEEGKRWK